MHGRYKRSQITIIHWKEDWEKQTFENYAATSSSGTTHATQSESGTRTIKQYTTTSHTESALRHRPHGKGDQPDNASTITHCHKASRQRPIANSWTPSLKRSTHEWHEFGQAPKHLLLMCCYSMRCMEKSPCVCFHFFDLVSMVFCSIWAFLTCLCSAL